MDKIQFRNNNNTECPGQGLQFKSDPEGAAVDSGIHLFAQGSQHLELNISRVTTVSHYPCNHPGSRRTFCLNFAPLFLLPIFSVSSFFAFPEGGIIKLHWTWKSFMVKAGHPSQARGVTDEQVQSVKNIFMKSQKKLITTLCWWKKHQFPQAFVYLLVSKWKSVDVKLTIGIFTNNTQSTSECPVNHTGDRGGTMKTFCCTCQFHFGVLSGFPCY